MYLDQVVKGLTTGLKKVMKTVSLSRDLHHRRSIEEAIALLAASHREVDVHRARLFLEAMKLRSVEVKDQRESSTCIQALA